MTTLTQRVPLGAQAAGLRATFALPRPVQRRIAGKPVRVDSQELALDAQLLLRLFDLSGMSLSGLNDPVAARAQLDASSSMTAGPTIQPVITRELRIPTPDGSLDARLYSPAGVTAPAPLLVFYHGGGWVIGNVDSHDNVARLLAKQGGVRVLSVNYRLAPENPFPAAVDDALASFEYAHGHAAELGIDPARIAVGGDSAGGNLAAVVAHQTTRGKGPAPAFQLLIYPAVDFTTRAPSRDLFADGFFLTREDMDWFEDLYLPAGTDKADERLSVLRAADLSGLPPAYVVTAGFDPLRDEGEAYAGALNKANVPVALSRQPDLIHGFVNFIGLGGRFREATSEISAALRTGLTLAGR
ncbi:alpha/beta hydrolase [Haloechinothrix sp. YIM 98757]|uniref:Alpha/beta hydrolase n=1 Tax=Haloechinothrix aidingensis TaxID=2752311 RepID=A0A838AE13_9PSEU|nr:alpha/beta hydrolase [Haloechinothrix aidingensis]MBA0127427.1 alpha/beta hydrolase [Haloechinothrix aidingensis]